MNEVSTTEEVFAVMQTLSEETEQQTLQPGDTELFGDSVEKVADLCLGK